MFFSGFKYSTPASIDCGNSKIITNKITIRVNLCVTVWLLHSSLSHDGGFNAYVSLHVSWF